MEKKTANPQKRSEQKNEIEKGRKSPRIRIRITLHRKNRSKNDNHGEKKSEGNLTSNTMKNTKLLNRDKSEEARAGNYKEQK